MSCRWMALACAFVLAAGCASSKSHKGGSSTHAARPIPRGRSVSPSPAAPQGRSSSHSSSDSTSACLGLLCDVGVCFAEAAADSAADGLASSDDDSDVIQVPPGEAAPPAQPLEVAPAAEAPHAGYFPPELPAAIEQAQVLLRSGNYEGFLNRFLSRDDREALARTPERNLTVELGNGRADVLLRDLAICREAGVALESGDRVSCVGTPERLTWRLEPQGWAIEGLAVATPAPAPPSPPGDVPAAGS